MCTQRDLASLPLCRGSSGRRAAVIVFTAILAITPGRSIAAQSSAPRVDIGSRVRVTVTGAWGDLPSGTEASRLCDEALYRQIGPSSRSGSGCQTLLAGGLVAWSADSLVLSQNGIRMALRPEQVQRLEVSRGYRTDAARGALVGLFVGAAAGGAAYCAVGSCSDMDALGLAIFAPAGGFLGGMIGALLGAANIYDEWEVVSVDAVKITMTSTGGIKLVVHWRSDPIP